VQTQRRHFNVACIEREDMPVLLSPFAARCFRAAYVLTTRDDEYGTGRFACYCSDGVPEEEELSSSHREEKNF